MGQKIDNDKIIAHLNSKWEGRNCQMCETGKWSVSDSIFELREYNQGNMVIGSGPIIPIVPVICENCGNTILVNAIKAGLIEPNKK